MNFDPETVKTGPSFYPPSVNSVVCFIVGLRTRRLATELNQTLPNGRVITLTNLRKMFRSPS